MVYGGWKYFTRFIQSQGGIGFFVWQREFNGKFKQRVV
jgi:hypothetical protein